MTDAPRPNALPDDLPLVLGPASTSILLTLAYFALFRHPLREDELLRHSHFYALTPDACREALDHLLDADILVRTGEMIHIRGDESLPAIRAEREARAAGWEARTARSAAILAHLPFLRGLLLSGSLSKGTQDPGGDIDFLVVTAGNRLWTTRFFASLLLKATPRPLRRNFCLNYFLPGDRLAIPDRTLFSATEVAFLRPLLGSGRAFFDQNAWVRGFYPSWEPPAAPARPGRAPLLQRLLEWPLSGGLGDRFEAWASRWFIHRITTFLSTLEAPLARDARVGPWEIKGHTKGRHNALRTAWHTRTNRLEESFNIRLIRWPWGRTPLPDQSHAAVTARIAVPLELRIPRRSPAR